MNTFTIENKKQLNHVCSLLINQTIKEQSDQNFIFDLEEVLFHTPLHFKLNQNPESTEYSFFQFYTTGNSEPVFSYSPESSLIIEHCENNHIYID